MAVQVREQKEVIINDNKYIIHALMATKGIDTMNALKKMSENGEDPDGFFIKDIVMSSVTFKNKMFDDKSFDIHFSKKWVELFKLFEEILEFNFDIKVGTFDDEDSPND